MSERPSSRAISVGLVIPGLPPLGSLAFAAAIVCAVSGLILLPGYDPQSPLASLLQIETARPWGWLFRGIHRWSAELFFALLVVHTIDFLVRRADRELRIGRWALLIATLPATAYLMLGGLALTGDAEGFGVASVMRGLASLIPVAGELASRLLVGSFDDGAVRTLYLNHVATASVALGILIVVHVKRRIPDPTAIGVALGISGIAALAVRPALGPAQAQGRLHGPWFMIGLRWLLERWPAWLAGLTLPLGLLLILLLLPRMPARLAGMARVLLAGALVGYLVLMALGARP